MKTLFDYFLICLVGFVAGAWIMIGTVYFDLSPTNLLSGLWGKDDTQTTAVASASKDPPSFSSIENSIAEPRKTFEERRKDPGETLKWLRDGSIFVEEVKYLEEANCSDHAMRQYAGFIRSLDTNGFDEKTGRLITAEGDVTNRLQWAFLYKNALFQLHPLQYMKDEIVPKNFKHVMKAIPRRKNWKTCSFKIPLPAVLGTFN